LKLEDTRAEYYFYSGKVSDIARQLGLAGIAIIWIFKAEVSGIKDIPDALIPAGIFLLLGLTADLFQYAAGTVLWHRFNRKKEVELERRLETSKIDGVKFNPEAEDFTAPSSINDLTIVLFWAKVTLILLAYIILIFYLITQIR
jgi:hypothetical protein